MAGRLCGQEAVLLAPEAVGPLFPQSLRKGLGNQVGTRPTDPLLYGLCFASIKALCLNGI